MNRWTLSVIVAACCLLLGGFLNTLASMAKAVPNPLNYEEFALNVSGKYNVPTVEVPRSTGSVLRFTEYIFNSVPMSELVRNFFYKSTQFYRVRFLADQLKNAPRLGFPFKRLPNASASPEEDVLGDLKKIKRITKYKSVLDFHQNFLSISKPSVVLKRVLAHAEAIQAEYKPFKVLFSFADLKKLALESDKRFAAGKPLSVWDGVPIAVKDEMAVVGSAVSLGRDPSVATFHVPAKEDDAIIAEFRRQGAIVIGVTVMHELGISALGWNKHVQGPFNAWSKQHMAGGSTAGCGVAVAAGIVPVCIGYDGGGSVRIPAAWNGVFGLAPTFGRVMSTATSISHFSTIHVGPIAATVIDTALAHRLMASVHVDDHIYRREYGPNMPSVRIGGSELVSVLESKNSAMRYLKNLKVGMFHDWINDSDSPVLKVFNQVVKSVFPNTVSFEIPHMFEQQLSHGIAFMTEMALVHQQSFYNPKEFPLEPATRVALGMATAVSGIDLVAAEKIKGWSRDLWEAQFAKFNVVILPTQGSLPYPITDDIYEEGLADSTFVVKMVTKTFVANLHGYPAITVPIGTANQGETPLPVGLQVMCPHWDDHVCITVAAALETVLERTTPPCFKDVLVV